MGVVFSTIGGVACLIVGIHGARALRAMMRQGRSYVLYDWRRLIGKDISFDRDSSPNSFWVTIFLNAFLVTITGSMAIGIILMLGIGAAAAIFGQG